MPVDMSLRARILARAGNRCERCGIDNGAYREIWTDQNGPGKRHYRYAEKIDGEWYGWNHQDGDCWMDEAERLDRKPARIVLTIAHVHNSDPQNCADDNLAALCQRCHNRLDAPMRARHATETRRRQRMAISGQMALPLEEVTNG